MEDKKVVPCAPTVYVATKANAVWYLPRPMQWRCPSRRCLTDIISKDTFNQMLKHRDDTACPARGFYTYDAFIQAAKSLLAFGSTGDVETRMREITAFLGQTSHETSGGWPSAPDGPYSWGYCFNKEVQQSTIFYSTGASSGGHSLKSLFTIVKDKHTL